MWITLHLQRWWCSAWAAAGRLWGACFSDLSWCLVKSFREMEECNLFSGFQAHWPCVVLLLDRGGHCWSGRRWQRRQWQCSPGKFRERTQWECPGNKDKKLELELMASNKVLNAVAMLSEPFHPWNCPRPGWTGLGAAWSGERSPCPWNSEMRWALQSLPTQTTLEFSNNTEGL